MPYWDKQQAARLAITAKAMAHQPWRHPLIGVYYPKDS